MPRISENVCLMDMAECVARRATCYKGGVGAILVRGINIISSGYNGPPSGESHCHGMDCVDEFGKCSRAIHAEVNAIKKIALNGCVGSKIFVTRVPCYNCARLIYESRISAVYYRHVFRDFQGLVWLETQTDLPLYRVTANGFVENYRTKMLVEGID